MCGEAFQEETHYYRFGLTMTGISSKAAPASDCGCPNKKGFNGNELQSKEFSDGSGLEVYDFNARTYDQQIGRFIQIDPLLEVGQENLSSYQFGWNNPIRYNDPDGKCPICPFIPLIIEGGKALVAAYVAYTVVDANKENIQKASDYYYSLPFFLCEDPYLVLSEICYQRPSVCFSY